ncbi:group 1 truncated hemoglobin [Streptomyces sp. SID8379]|uniref:group I truncated hemoglobin n=1 Tax=unclassified Streptomyces TaxID=2593676 RepID=UPI0005BA6893|nr:MULTISPECIES: group 1 truncated hemoglobin [unclassified Streptomyces]MYW66588.1 group 1 truncated hemoglobin [Streptomyces sp. SID8379]
MSDASVYERGGGAPAVAAVVDLFYARVLADDHLSPHFGTTDLPAMKAHQRAFIATALGGPETYRGRPLAEAHAQLALKEADFDRVVQHLAESLAEAGVDEPLIAEIATRLTPLKQQIVR